jgi:hypothetical protein
MNAPAKSNASQANTGANTKANATLATDQAGARGADNYTDHFPLYAAISGSPPDRAGAGLAAGQAGARGTATVPVRHVADRATDNANTSPLTALFRGHANTGDGDDARVARGGPPAAERLDDKFIETHDLIERYLTRKLPPEGARALEKWCRAHPEYLLGLNLAERVQASLHLLEAAERLVDLSEPKTPWWKSPYVLIACVTLALASLGMFWALNGHYELLRSELEDARTRLQQGSLEQPATRTEVTVTPDRAPGLDKARIAVNRNAPMLIDLHIDMRHAKASQYRLIVDKKDQGRALIVDNLLKDSNGELRLTFNTSGLAAGIYDARIDALPMRGNGSPESAGWLMLEVH